MKVFSSIGRALIGLGFVGAIGCMQAGPSFAGVQDSVFFISPDGGNVAFDVRDVSRREVLGQLLRSKAIELEWVDSTFAEERISGAFKGSTDAVLQRLLAQTDFVVVYARDGDQSRIARLIVVGKTAASPKSVELSGTNRGAAPPPAGHVPGFTPATGTIALTPPSPADLAGPLFVPAPAGTAAPALIPPSEADKVLPPLISQGPTTTR